MSPIVHLHQMLGTHVRIALGRAESAVAQELLDEAEIRALAKHMCGERVTERVRAHPPVDARRAGPRLHDAMGAPRGEAASPRIGEERAAPFATNGEPRFESL